MGILVDLLSLLVMLGAFLLSYIQALYRVFVPVARKSVAGRRILITGAGHGLGRLMALAFARLDAVLVLWDINKANNENTAREVAEVNAEVIVHTYTVDCSSSEAVTDAAQRVTAEVGHVYMLVNNAGVLVGEDLLTLTDRDIRRTMDVNIMAHFWTLRNFLPDMLERNEGHVVSVASMAGKQGTHRLTDYCASKHAALGLNEALADEISRVYDKSGVLTTAVCPMFTDTGIIHGVNSRLGSETMMKAEAVVDRIVDGILRNETEILIPNGLCRIALLLKALLPVSGYQAFLKANAITVPPQAKKTK